MEHKKDRDIFVDGQIEASFIAKKIAEHGQKRQIGAHSLFLGQVRNDEIDSKPVTAIAYTAYKDLALQQMTKIREEVFAAHSITCLHIYHSLGLVKAGEICLFVFASAARRKPAMAACNEIVERIKAELPIWGKEIFADQSHQWKENN